MSNPAFLPGTPQCPLATAHLPGLGGQLGPEFADFLVDEIPAYAPSGEGDHWFVRLRKRDLTTEFACRQLARAAGIQLRDMGIAGRKDRRAITTQWISMPVEPVDPEREGLEILETVRHEKKLRRGHVRGNRFTIRVVNLDPAAAERLPALLEQINAGVPNYFGEQRFGRANVERALSMLDTRRRSKDDRFLASALQSAVFNHWLGARVQRGDLGIALEGDVMKKRLTGGLFDCVEPEVDSPRVASGEIDPTGPMVGPKMWPTTAAAAAFEAESTVACGLDDEKRAQKLGKLAAGTRRVARLVPDDLKVEIDGDSAVVQFTLRAGSYATIILAELLHPEGPLRQDLPRPTPVVSDETAP